MDKNNITLFALNYLKTHTMIDEIILQKYIKERPEIDKVIPIDDIQLALDDAYRRGLIIFVFSDETRTIYSLNL